MKINLIITSLLLTSLANASGENEEAKMHEALSETQTTQINQLQLGQLTAADTQEIPTTEQRRAAKEELDRAIAERTEELDNAYAILL